MADFTELGESVAHLDVSILVNNAGCSTIFPLEQLEYQELESMVNLNTGPYVYLTRALLPRMLKREKRSGIIFNASIAAEFMSPCLGTYCGSKAFVDHFAKSLAFENPDKIDVLSYKPNMVQSNIVRIEIKPSFSILTAVEAADSALDKLGWDVETEGHWRHVVCNTQLRLSSCFLPQKTLMRVSNREMRKMGEVIKAMQAKQS